MSLILSIETATTVCSVALHRNGVLQEYSLTLEPYAASSQLAVMIDQVLKKAKLKPSDLEAVAVSSGPGSYTGLRIGVATAKGLCYSLGIPLIAVNTLVGMVKRVKDDASEGLLCPMIDARRMEVYCMLWGRREGIVEDTHARVIDPSSFASYLERGSVTFFGNGSAKCQSVITHKNAFFLKDVIPSAEQVGELASEKYEAKEFEDTFNFEPRYLKEFLIKKPKSI